MYHVSATLSVFHTCMHAVNVVYVCMRAYTTLTRLPIPAFDEIVAVLWKKEVISPGKSILSLQHLTHTFNSPGEKGRNGQKTGISFP